MKGIVAVGGAIVCLSVGAGFADSYRQQQFDKIHNSATTADYRGQDGKKVPEVNLNCLEIGGRKYCATANEELITDVVGVLYHNQK
jgi:hypothetical protein